MGSYGGFYKGEKKKLKKDALERRASQMSRVSVSPQIEIIGKGKGKK